MTPLRCLVAGGAGFIGSHLTDRLLAAGHDVTVLDSFLTGSRENLTQLRGNPRARVVTHDVCFPVPDLGVRFDRIFNLACPASPIHYQRDPIHTWKTSVLGALHMLEYAEWHGARYFQASTSEVYGDPEEHPQRESYRGCVNTLGPRACYDEGKRAAESLCMDFARQRGVEVRMARIFNTYGPRMATGDGRVVSNFIVQGLRGESLTVFGDGSQTRSFCFVDDLLTGIERLMEHPDAPGPVNLGNTEEFTMIQLAEQVRELTGLTTPVVFLPLPADDPRQRRPDLSRARELLGYEPRVKLAEGLSRTAAYFRKRLAQPPLAAV